MKCKSCGAELKGNICEYCGTAFKDGAIYIPPKEKPIDRFADALRGLALVAQGYTKMEEATDETNRR